MLLGLTFPGIIPHSDCSSESMGVSVPLLVLVLIYSCWSLHTRDWNEREIITNLSLVEGKVFPFENFNPFIARREDGSDFVSVALVDHPGWIGMALNSFFSLIKFQSRHSITILTVNNPEIANIFRRLGFYAYDAGDLVTTFPPDFQPAKILSWSWNEIIFLRFNLWMEAFKRNIGFCSLDLDVTYNQNVFFGPEKEKDGTYSDISIQGMQLPLDHGKEEAVPCKATSLHFLTIFPFSYPLR